MAQQPPPPDKTKEAPPKQPDAPVKAGETVRQDPGKAPEKPADAVPGKATQEQPASKEGTPSQEIPQPVIPLQPPPGALIPVAPKPAAGKFQIGSILEPALWLIAILTVGAILLAWLKKSRDRQLGGLALSANDQLSAFREALDEGEMTEEEFKKVKALLAEKIRNPVKAAPTVTGATPQTREATAPEEAPN